MLVILTVTNAFLGVFVCILVSSVGVKVYVQSSSHLILSTAVTESFPLKKDSFWTDPAFNNIMAPVSFKREFSVSKQHTIQWFWVRQAFWKENRQYKKKIFHVL